MFLPIAEMSNMSQNLARFGARRSLQAIGSILVVAAADAATGQAMVRAIIALAVELGVEVIAAGVATQQQRAALVKMSAATKGQGFYFGIPMRAEDTTQNLRLNLSQSRFAPD